MIETPNSIKAVIFDMDGVLLDSTELHYQAYARAFREIGLDAPAEIKSAIRNGNSRTTIIKMFANSVSSSEFERIYRLKADYSKKLIRELGRSEADNALLKLTEPSLPQLLSKLSQYGIKLAVATSSNLSTELLSATKLSNYFHVICDATPPTLPKPSPDVYQAAVRALKQHPKNCLAIEDSEIGMKAAIGAEIFTLRYCTSSNKKSIGKSQPYATISRLNEILNFLK